MNSMVHLSSRIQHQAEYKELLANAEHQIKRIGLIKGNSKTRQDQQIRNMKRFLKLINENFNPNFTQSPHDFFILNVSENHEKFIEFVKSNHKSINIQRIFFNSYNFLINEVLPRRNTIQWIGLESSEVEIFSFNENLSDQDRVILCLKRIVFNYHPLSTQKTAYALSRYLETIFAKELGSKIYGARMFEAVLRKETDLFFVKDEEYEAYTSARHYAFYKPLSLLDTIQKLSLAPDNYLDGKRILTQKKASHNVRKRVPKGATPRKAARKALPFEYITDDFKKELHLVALYKTTPILLGKKRNGTWVVRKSKANNNNDRTILNAEKLADLAWLDRSIYVPSLDIFSRTLIELLHFCVNNKCLSPEKFTIFHLADPEIWINLVNHTINESGFITEALVASMSSLRALWNAESSVFLEYGKEYFFEKYNLSESELLNLCHRNYDLFNEHSSDIKKYVKTSPHSVKVLNAPVCDLDVPIQYIFDIIERAKKDVEPHLESAKIRMLHFNTFRDIVLATCVSRVPLRLRNWADMRVGYDFDNECIYKKDDLWHLSIPKHCFKNYRQEIIPDHFKYAFDENVSRLIDRYMELRVKFGHENIEYFCVSSKNIKNNTDTVSTNFYSITEKYRDPNVLDKGINIHYMRDIVATTFLKKHKGAFGYVAYLLLDSEEMIRNHYGHLSPSDAFSEWGNYLESLKNEKLEG